MGSLASHRSDHRVAHLRVSSQVRPVLSLQALDQLTSIWGVSDTVAGEMFARLAGPDRAAWERQASKCGYCAHPVRLTGRVVDGNGAVIFDTRGEPDGVLLKRCGNRRRSL